MSLKRVHEILESLPGLACPHCGAGRDAQTVGLVWDSIEQDWRCVICGYRAYEGKMSPPSDVDEPITSVDSDGVQNASKSSIVPQIVSLSLEVLRLETQAFRQPSEPFTTP